MINPEKTESFVSQFWEENIIPTLIEYIRIPNKSPYFQPDWESAGHMEKVLQLALSWLEKHKIPDSQLHVGQIPGRTPLLLLEIPGDTEETVLMYGHLDKQPEMTGWEEGLGPWEPVIREDKLYGRGGADDGYALFSSVCAIKAIKEQNLPLPRIVVLIEFSEESGSPDLPPYIDQFRDVIGSPSLVVCLDSGAGNYDQLWCTNSLRGVLSGILKVEVLKEGVHSGEASGAVPSSFRILCQLLQRVESLETGEIFPAEMKVEIPQQQIEQAKQLAKTLGEKVYNHYPFPAGMKPVTENVTEIILNRTWRATLSYIAQEGMPAPAEGGNVLRPYTLLKLSFRLPPTLEPEKAQRFLQKALSENPPYGAHITASFNEAAVGWNAPELADWLEKLLEDASQTYYGKPSIHMGEGGSIPFMGMLGEKFPEAQFVITGVLGPQSNAHGPNEFLHIPYAKKLTSCVAQILTQFTQRKG